MQQTWKRLDMLSKFDAMDGGASASKRLADTATFFYVVHVTRDLPATFANRSTSIVQTQGLTIALKPSRAVQNNVIGLVWSAKYGSLPFY